MHQVGHTHASRQTARLLKAVLEILIPRLSNLRLAVSWMQAGLAVSAKQQSFQCLHTDPHTISCAEQLDIVAV